MPPSPTNLERNGCQLLNCYFMIAVPLGSISFGVDDGQLNLLVQPQERGVADH